MRDFAFGAALAGLAGALIVPVFSLFADLGIRFLIQGFVAAWWRPSARLPVAVAGAGVNRDVERRVAVGDLSVVQSTGVCSSITFIKFPAARSHVRKRGLVPMSKQNSNLSRRRSSAICLASTDCHRCRKLVVRPDWANAAESPSKWYRTDLTGPIDYAGNADANVARMVVRSMMRAVFGPGRWSCLSKTPRQTKLRRGRNVRKLFSATRFDLVLGGITSSMRNAIKDVIVARGKTVIHLSAAV